MQIGLKFNSILCQKNASQIAEARDKSKESTARLEEEKRKLMGGDDVCVSVCVCVF